MQIEHFKVTPEYITQQGLSLSFPERFFSKIRFTDSCWIWTGYVMENGYGQVSRGHRFGMMLAHRASWIIHFGPIPDGFDVLHDCPDGDTPSCVNPAHLWVGDAVDNMRDCVAKGRYVTHDCKGEAHAQHKLMQNDVLKIREMHASGGITQGTLAKLFNVTPSNIYHIIKRLTWTHC